MPARLTFTPPLKAESCNSIASGAAPTGTSDDTTVLAIPSHGLILSPSPGAPVIGAASNLLPLMIKC